MRQPGVYEHPLGDLVLPGIAHCIGKDIIIINTSSQVRWCIQVVLASSLKGNHATTDIPIIVAYNQVHYEGLVPNTDEDIRKSIELKHSFLSNAIVEKVDSNPTLRQIYNIPSQASFADVLKLPCNKNEESCNKVFTENMEIKNVKQVRKTFASKRHMDDNRDITKKTQHSTPSQNLSKRLTDNKVVNSKKAHFPMSNQKTSNIFDNLKQEVVDTCKVCKKDFKQIVNHLRQSTNCKLQYNMEL